MSFSLKTAFKKIRELNKVTCLVNAGFCELPYLYQVLQYLCEKPFCKNYEFVITDHLTPVPNLHSGVIVFYLSNEDHRTPEYANDVKLVLTPYPPQNAHPNIKGIPLGPNGQVPQKPIRPIDHRKQGVFFSGRRINRRKAFSEGLKSLEKIEPKRVEAHWTKGFKDGFAPERYAEKLNQYGIVPAPEGNFSNITFRLFEAMRQGCVVLAPPLPNTWFFQETPFITVPNWHDLPEIVKDLLKDPSRMDSIQKDTINFYRDYCSEKAVANYITSILEKKGKKSYT